MARKQHDQSVLKLSVLTAALCVGVLVAVGAASASSPTKSQFIHRGDALCAQAKRELLPLRRQAEAAKTLPREQMWTAATSLWTKQLVIQTRFVTRFRALGVPAGDARARTIVAGLGRGLMLTRGVRDAFASRSTSQLATSLRTFLSYTVSLNRRVVAYGFDVCGR